MEPDDVAFLNAILDHAGEATQMAVYADWLEEHSRLEQSEYIRLLLDQRQFRFGPGNPDRDQRIITLRYILPQDWLTLVEGAYLLNDRSVERDEWYHVASSEFLWALADEQDASILDGVRFVAPFGHHGFFQRAFRRGFFLGHQAQNEFGFTVDEAAAAMTALGEQIVRGARPVLAICHPTERLRTYFIPSSSDGIRRARFLNGYRRHPITDDWSVLSADG